MNKNKKMPLIGISGKAGSGKDTVAQIIQYLSARKGDVRDVKIQTAEFKGLDKGNWEAIHNRQDFKIVKFADKLKDIVCLLLNCTREQLEDREFKEKELGEEWGVWKVIRQDGTQFGGIHENKKDAEFSLSICSFSNVQVVFEKMTPRKMLQQVGTDLFRKQLQPNTWTNATFANYQDDNWIITDVRFPNELEAVKKHNGITIRINRGLVERTGKLIQEPEHISETALDDAKFDYIIENNGTIEELLEQVKKILIKEEII